MSPVVQSRLLITLRVWVPPHEGHSLDGMLMGPLQLRIFGDSERTECSAVSSRLLSQCVDVPRQPRHNCHLCSENLVGKTVGRGPQAGE